MSFFRLFGILQTGSIHPEAQNWAARVAANGGTVSPDTLKAVSDFCKETASIRSLFLRLNLFCGNNLNAALVPLYLGEAPGIVYGNTVDTNINFVAGDYTERGTNGGLVGNGTNKYLNTGFAINSVTLFGQNNSSLSVYNRTEGAITAIELGNRVTSPSLRFTRLSVRNTTDNLTASINDQADNPEPSTNSLGLRLISRILAGTKVYYFNTSSVSKSQATAGKANTDMFVFAQNDLGLPNTYSSRRLAAYHFGRGFNLSQVEIFYSALQKFQTALNRQV